MFQAARALSKLGILKFLGDKGAAGATSEETAGATGISVYGVEVLLDAGLSMGLAMLRDDHYILTKTGFFVLNDPMTRVNIDFIHDVCYEPSFYLEESVKSGKPEGLKVFGDWGTIYPGLQFLPDAAKKSWFAFDHFYSDKAFPEVIPIIAAGNHRNLMDVGGNTGKFAFQCVSAIPGLHVTIVDLPDTLGAAEKNIREKGYSDRVSFHAADMLNPGDLLPSGFDAIWMSQFLDCFSRDQIVSILTRAREAMHEGSVLYILELLWDRQQYEASSYSLNATSLYFTCLANGNSRMYHSTELEELIVRAGLKVVRSTDRIGISHTLIECKKD
jgi:ubiquinone/menaquinone biosynthesis C-methylase UbiE